ncbi:polyphenol oxidase, chloroplastic-like [Magnolia sinica]|uniref:polyphenol oxidase, chloroplastic-like n=1 Tax=Magnolia sinica TaxID=86752 RepID=UPI00265A7692|nr:polyphenol oxidase, chloroplastic-like [Magnolia sinica]
MSMASMMMSSLQATASSAPSLHPKTSYSSRNAPRRSTTCIRSSGDKSGEESPLIKLDRRNMLIGLGGGLYGTTLGLGLDKKAAADPVLVPDLRTCKPAHDLFNTTNTTDYACCLPLPTPYEITDYIIPNPPSNPGVRKPAHKMATDYPEELTRFETAIQKMRDLDTTDPNSPLGFRQQAQIHCAFCNGAYSQYNKEAIPLQVHFSWFFLPWHRWYIYFFERILTKLLDDGNPVTLPYWNYDSTAGMGFPGIYADSTSSLYDDLRNKVNAVAGNNVDLFYSPDNTRPLITLDPQLIVNRNLCYFQTIFDAGASDPLQFIGCPITAGDQSNFAYAGYLENLHNVVHQWTGTTDDENNNNFDMGNFLRAARDPIFYAHHSNVDRLWEIFRTRNNASNFEAKYHDWLNSSFVFYDENAKLVKVTVSQSLNIGQLGYSYESLESEWNCNDVNMLPPKSPSPCTSASSVQAFGALPKALENDPIRVLVKRPNSSRSKSEIQNTLEVVMVDGIEVEHTSSTRFDVFINTPSEDCTNLGDFAGSFTTVAHGAKHGETSDGNEKKLGLKLGITSMVSKLNAEAAENLVVSLVPRMGSVVVGGVHIEQVEKKTV